MSDYGYCGITYPSNLDNKRDLDMWRDNMCIQGFHLFDEVYNTFEHYLFCDGCGLIVHIAGIDQDINKGHNTNE